MIEASPAAESRRPSLLSEWVGLLGSPVSWLLQLQAIYSLTLWACDDGGRWPLHGAAMLGLVMATSSGMVAVRNWRLIGKGWPSDADEGRSARVRTMAALGMLSGALFSLVIVGQWLAIVMLNPCPT